VLENFTNLREVQKKDDPMNHIIVLRGSGECYAAHSFGDTIENAGHAYTLEIITENSGYKYSLSDFKTTDKWKGEINSEEFKGGKKQVQLHEQTLQELIATLTKSLKLAMATKVDSGGD
jgi:hypothetical protein